MSPQLQLPAGCERYLALQRTAYQHPINMWFRKLRMGRLYDKYLMPTIESTRTATLSQSYARDLAAEYETLLPALPRQLESVLDIGCGLAGIDVLLQRKYGEALDVHLLDRNGVSEIFYGFKSDGAFYNSLPLARALLEMNGVPAARVHTHDADRQGFPKAQRFGLIMSLISWGYHYPVKTYAADVQAALAPGGTLIIDIRRGTTGKEELQDLLGVAPALLQSVERHERLAFTTAASASVAAGQ